MAYVAPNSTVEFYSNIGLSDNYDDSLYFATTAAKDTYFNSITKLATAQSLSYNRQQRGFIRVELPMSTLISATYMRFKNTSFENKWFYAFVKNVEYINNNCTQINFAIDPLLTWMGSFTLNQCFIERQHTTTDNIGEHICDEGLETGEYVCQGSSTTAFFGDYTIVIFQSEDAEGAVYGLNYGGIFSGANMYVATDAANATDHIEDMVAAHKGDSIVAIEMIPSHYLGNTIIGSDTPISDTFSVTKPYTSLGGYTPRNKKLYCYPYNFLTVYNSEGETADYMYEYFETLPNATSSGEAYFTITGAANIQTEISCIPKNYKGVPLAYSEALSMVKFPMCSWNIDTYKAYLAQMQSMAVQGVANTLLRTAVSAGAGALVGGVAGAGMGAAQAIGDGAYMLGAMPAIYGGMASGAIGTAGNNARTTLMGAQGSDIANITRILATQWSHPSMPVQNRGRQTNDLMVGLKAKNFYFYKMCVTKNYAKMIDDYFDAFGYAIREHAVPNMNARPYWTYVKTVGCSLEGNLPADDASAIETIFNNGIRFWKNHTNIGDYSLNNAPSNP